MQRTVFLDVGAHEGQTLEVVVGRFDRIHAFEPMPEQYAKLIERDWNQGEALFLHSEGLAAATGEFPVYGSNEGMEASIYPDKLDLDASVSTMCLFKRATEFFQEWISYDFDVLMKLNCEGAEVAIMGDLLDSGQAWKLRNVMIDFDVRKIPSQAHREQELLDRMADDGFDRFSLCEDVMVGATHADRINAWLSSVGVGAL